MDRYGLTITDEYGSPLDGRAGEFISWRNLHGFPINYISPFDVRNHAERYLAGTVDGTRVYRDPSGGTYNITVDGDSYEGFRSVYDAIMEEYINASPLDSSVLFSVWSYEAYTEAQAVSPVQVSVSNGSNYNRLGVSVDRLQMAIDYFNGDLNGNIIEGVGVSFSQAIFGGAKAQINIGSRYYSPWDQHQEILCFGNIPVGGSSPIRSVLVKNESGETLTSLTAQVLPKIAVRQPEYAMPFRVIDQHDTIYPDVTSPFEVVSILFDETAGRRVKANGEFYDMLILPEDQVWDKTSPLTGYGDTTFCFGADAPCAGLSFVLNIGVDNTHSAFAYLNNGHQAFQVSTDSSVWSWGGISLTDLDIAEEGLLYVKANPVSSIFSSDDYGTEGILQIIAEYETPDERTELELTPVSSSDTPSHQAVRVVLSALTEKISEARVCFTSLAGRLKVNDAYIGARSGSGAAFSTNPTRLTFSEEDGFDLTSATSIWSDWVDVEMVGGDYPIISYQGPLVGAVTGTGTSWTKTQGEDAGNLGYEGYEETTSVFDIINVEVRKKRYAVARVPLIATIPENLTQTTFDFAILDEYTTSAMQEASILFEYVEDL